jgi:hypothetical protein
VIVTVSYYSSTVYSVAASTHAHAGAARPHCCSSLTCMQVSFAESCTLSHAVCYAVSAMHTTDPESEHRSTTQAKAPETYSI